MNSDINIVKNFILFILSIALITATISIFVIPNIKAYRELSSKFRQEMLTLENTKEFKSNIDREFNKIKSDGMEIISSFKNRFSKSKFTRDSRKFFSNISLKEVKSEDESKFTTYEFSASANVKSPTNFYNFLEYLSTYSNVIKVDFPILFKSKGNIISTEFKLKVYNLAK